MQAGSSDRSQGDDQQRQPAAGQPPCHGRCRGPVPGPLQVSNQPAHPHDRMPQAPPQTGRVTDQRIDGQRQEQDRGGGGRQQIHAVDSSVVKHRTVACCACLPQIQIISVRAA